MRQRATGDIDAIRSVAYLARYLTTPVMGYIIVGAMYRMNAILSTPRRIRRRPGREGPEGS